MSWADSTLSTMSIEEKVGQLFVPDVVAVYNHSDSPVRRYAIELIRKYHVGGFVLAGGTVSDIALMTNVLQRESRLPLLINADLEGGLGFSHPWTHLRGRGPELPKYIPGGGTAFTSMMAVGATGNPQYAYDIGRITARESRAVGIHWTNSPVADVNNNPENPIINTRSFGEDAVRVAAFVEAYVRGVQEGGVIATMKHFPGHGDTKEDTHIKLPLLQFDEKRIFSIELVPFKAGIAAGAKAVMTAHIALPRIDPTNRPSTLSYPIISGVLREKLGFHGIVITDGMTMQGVTDHYGADEAAVLAIEAGADCVLVPNQFENAYNGVLAAAKSGRIAIPRLDASVRRILEAKSWVGLDRDRFVNIEHVADIVGAPESDSLAQTIADAAVTLLRNNNGIVPLDRSSRAHVVTVSDDFNAQAGEELARVLSAGLSSVQCSHLFAESRDEVLQKIIRELKNADIIIVGLYLSIGAWKGRVEIPTSLATFLDQLQTLHKHVITVAFGDPYVIAKVPKTDVTLAVYSGSLRGERSVGKALLGNIDITGKLPVTIPGKYAIGQGIEVRLSKRSTER